MSINVQNSTNRVIITPPKAPRRIIISSNGTQGATGAYFRIVDTEADLIPSFGNDRDTAITIIDGLEYYKANGVWSATGRTFWGTLLQDTSAYAIAAAAGAASAASSQAATSADRVATGLDKAASAASALIASTKASEAADDRVQTGLDRTAASGSAATATTKAGEAAASAVQTTADRVATGQDKAAAAASAAAALANKQATDTAKDQAEASSSTAVAAATTSTANATATGQDKAATAADRVATGQDKTVSSAAAVTAIEQAGVATTKAGEAASSATATAADRTAVAEDRTATQIAQAGAEAARDVSLSTYANLTGGTTGQIPMKASGSDFDFTWGNPAVGDMLSSTWASIINANADARHTHSNKAVLDATTASFLTAEKTKLAGIAAGATANTGTVTSVAVAVPTGFTVTPAITTSGTITISYASGYQGYTTAEANKLAGIDLSLYQPLSAKNAANGYVGLGVDGKILITMLPDAVLGAMRFTGFWNATTNSPAIPAAAPANNGWYYIVQVAGTTSQGGVTDWEVGDWIVSNGTTWGKIDNTDAVVSVAGLKGAISAAALKAALALNLADNTSDANKPVSTAQAAADNARVLKSGDTMTGELRITDGANTSVYTSTGDIYGAAFPSGLMTTLNSKAGVYKGSDVDEVNFPIGHTIAVTTTTAATITRNGLVSPRLNPTLNYFYSSAGSGTLLTGVWRSRCYVGTHGNGFMFLVERVEQ